VDFFRATRFAETLGRGPPGRHSHRQRHRAPDGNLCRARRVNDGEPKTFRPPTCQCRSWKGCSRRWESYCRPAEHRSKAAAPAANLSMEGPADRLVTGRIPGSQQYQAGRIQSSAEDGSDRKICGGLRRLRIPRFRSSAQICGRAPEGTSAQDMKLVGTGHRRTDRCGHRQSCQCVEFQNECDCTYFRTDGSGRKQADPLHGGGGLPRIRCSGRITGRS